MIDPGNMPYKKIKKLRCCTNPRVALRLRGVLLFLFVELQGRYRNSLLTPTSSL
jgi:hypothetical protein